MKSPPFSPDQMQEALRPDRFHALMALLEASHCAAETGADPWEFALQMSSLARLGASDSNLRWLVVKGYAEHRLEEPTPGPGPRRFLSPGSLRLLESSCFQLTRQGYLLAQQLQTYALLSPAETSATPAVTSGPGASATAYAILVPDPLSVPNSLKPLYDVKNHTLWVGDQIVKQFRQAAGNQELILTGFQEESWPSRLDDPLPPVSNIDPKRRLHDTINRLNSHQRRPLLRFRGMEAGQAVGWTWSA